MFQVGSLVLDVLLNRKSGSQDILPLTLSLFSIWSLILSPSFAFLQLFFYTGSSLFLFPPLLFSCYVVSLFLTSKYIPNHSYFSILSSFQSDFALFCPSSIHHSLDLLLSFPLIQKRTIILLQNLPRPTFFFMNFYMYPSLLFISVFQRLTIITFRMET